MKIKNMKKICSLGLSLAMVMSGTAGSLKVSAANPTNVVENGNDITISNDSMSRTFTINGDNILTSKITNKLINLDLLPQAGSEDFIINTIGEDTGTQEPTGDEITNDPVYAISGDKIDTTNWTGTITNSAGTAFPDASVQKLFDNNLNTNPDEYTINGHPITVVIDMKDSYDVKSMTVNKRPGYNIDTYGVNGTMGGYEIYASNDGVEWTSVTTGEFTSDDYNLHQVGDLYNVGDTVYVNFDSAVNAQYMKVVQTSTAFGTAQEFTTAELGFYTSDITKSLVVKQPTEALDRSDWSYTGTVSDGSAYDQDQLALMFDGDTSTNPNQWTISGHPITIDIDLGSKQNVSSISVDKRPGYTDAAYGINGTMGAFELYVSDNGTDWTIAGAGEFTAEAYNLHKVGDNFNVGDRVYANFARTYNTQYVRLVQTSVAFGTAQELTTSELNIYSDVYQGPNWNTELPKVKSSNAILSSDLVYKNYNVSTTDDGGKKLTISYEPVTVNGVTYTIEQVVVAENEDHYMRSFIEVSVDDKDKAQIDYIDTDSFVLPSDAQGVWSIPDLANVSSMWIGKHELMLGQPIYVNGLFMGSEFPAAETNVVDNTTQVRYYSGKTFTKLQEDGQLTTDGKFVSWQNVLGAAQGTDTSVVQTSFFDYIQDIATPTDFRKQYNSWYDNMMNITDDSIASSFLGAESGLSNEGVEPLDSYVVDDGWNNYYDGTYTSTPGSAQGTTPNQTGFWEFNAKFPNELYTSSALSGKLQSTFGLWVGPQGGYNYFSSFAQYLQASGTGYVQSDYWNNICTGSTKYLDNWTKLFTDYQQRFDIGYWKWDGFAVRPCTNADHDHMTGGDNNMYYTSDMWEKWINVFTAVREARAAEGKDLWINATCYVNLSPWLLQWVNTIWVQDSGDTGQAGTGERHEQKIYYRDNVYYNLYKKNQVQFPLKNIYNHDPIYGVSDGSNATTDVFREYLFANAVRGTAFWELYYSPSLFDEAKYKVTADVLDWAESNFDILQNAKLFGNVPTNGVYGYSSWKGVEGIVSFTNPLDSEQTYTLKIDDVAGASKSLSNASAVQVYPYAVGNVVEGISYGDDLTVTLQPHETKILQFNQEDTTAPTVVSTENTANNTVRVKFSERINNDATFTVNGENAIATLLDDYRTVELTVATPFVSDGSSEVVVASNDVTDIHGNEYNGNNITFTAYANGVVADLTGLDKEIEPATGNAAVSIDNTTTTLADNGFVGTGKFGVAFSISTTTKDATILSQGNDLTISLKDGFVEAKIGNQTVSSKEEVTTVVEKAHGTFNTDAYVPTTTTTNVAGQINDGTSHNVVVAREANGMLKIYVDGALAGSAYDENKINESLAADEVVLGSSALKASIGNLTFVNDTISYSEVSSINDATAISNEKAVDRTGWVATACSEMSGMSGDASAMAAIDGNTSSWWHTNYVGNDTHEGNHWIQIDFNEDTVMNRFDYMGRGGSNGSIKTYKLTAKIDGEWQVVVENGTFDSSKEINSIEFDAPITASAVKLEILSSVGGFGAAKEINVIQYDYAVTKDDVKVVYDGLKTTFDATAKDNYTASSYATYKDAYDQFASYYNKVESGAATSAFVLEKVATMVNDAYAKLVEQVNTAPLAAAIKIAEGIDTTNKTAATVKVLTDAIEAAKDVLANPDVTAAQVAAATNTINEAIAGLEDKANTAALTIAVEEANKADLDNVVPAVVKEFNAALKQAQDVLEKEEPSQEEVDNAFDRLSSAMQMLEFKKGDKTQLQAMVDKIEALDLDAYIPSSYANLTPALELANKVLADENAMSEEVNETYDALVKAFLDLRLKPNKDLLLDLINKAEALNAKDYTTTSWTALATVLAEAKAVYANNEATSEMVNAIEVTLTNAIEGLEKVTITTPGTDTNVPTVNPSNPSVKPSTATGDDSNILMYLGLALVAGGVVFFRRKKVSEK